MQHTEKILLVKMRIFNGKKMIFFLGESVLTSIHNLCFEAKIRKIGIHLQTPFFLYKSGVQGGIHFTDMMRTEAFLQVQRNSGN